jgi:nicotinate-nucleotide adenylyltransferase
VTDTSGRKLGILGGTFNPPHLGHLLCAQEAHDRLGLDLVLFMPVALAPHKAIDDDPGPEVRAELCAAAVEGDERFEVSTLEVERGGPSYTVDTLRELHARHPDDELTFIVGGDMALSLPTWREPEAILSLARLAVAERRGAMRREIERRLAVLPGALARLDFLDLPRVDISSTMVRRRVAAGRPIRYLVPERVMEEIAARRLYRKGAVGTSLS